MSLLEGIRMSEQINIDEVKYFEFLNSVSNYVKKTSKLINKPELIEDVEWIQKYIKEQLKLKELIKRRDQNLKIYHLCKKTDIRAANAAYQNYLNVKAEIDKLRKENI